MPPTKQDIHHTIMRLFNEGLNQRQIVERLPYPKSMAAKLVKEAADLRRQANVRDAVSAVRAGDITIKQASEKYGVPVEQIQHYLPGDKRKRKGVGVYKEHKGSITHRFYALSRANLALVNKLFSQYDEGYADADDIIAVINDMSRLASRQVKSISDFRLRFEQIKRNGGSSSGPTLVN